MSNVPMYGFGGGSGTGGVLTVLAPAGHTVTISKDGKTKTKTANDDGVAVFKGLSAGAWTYVITYGNHISHPKTADVAYETTVTASYFSATINITYPAGSVCTATDGTTTLTAPDTSGTWECHVPNAGTWTVTVIDKGWTYITDITDHGQIISIDLSKRYLYKDGDQYLLFTGGLKGYPYGSSKSQSYRVNPSVIYGDTNITFSNVPAEGSAGSVSSLFVENAIDVTNFDTLEFNATGRSGVDESIGFGLTKTKQDKFISAAISIIKSTGNFSMDISGLTGDYYIFVTLAGPGNKSVSFDLFALE